MDDAGGRYALIGANGQLGFDLARTFDLPGTLVPLTRADIDVLDHAATARRLRELRPTHVVNTSAYNLVDRAEDEPRAAFALNADAVGNLAEVCQALGATFVHFSTDYVFDGRARTPYDEDAAPNPLGAYGASKLAGERVALERCERAFVFRVTGLFGVARSAGKGGTNFPETMLRLAREGRALRVVCDQVLTPSYTRDLAPKVWRVVARGRGGIYHLTNAGATSWYDFARAVFRLAGVDARVTPVTAAEYGARARRPAYSVLAHRRLAELGEDDLRPWDAALAAYLEERSTVTARAPGGS
ncbi:MAG TPA: dTDP-4-dehydrorhamnose reductase [Candidatus Tectomicrobia bacterium]|nr:dTDP-4-dehydrorhamnose reductase [Candidatus Tectomicrobia bacterium]